MFVYNFIILVCDATMYVASSCKPVTTYNQFLNYLAAADMFWEARFYSLNMRNTLLFGIRVFLLFFREAP